MSSPNSPLLGHNNNNPDIRVSSSGQESASPLVPPHAGYGTMSGSSTTGMAAPTRPSPLAHPSSTSTSSSSSLASRAMAVRAAHRFTSTSPSAPFAGDDSALSPTSIDMPPPHVPNQGSGRPGNPNPIIREPMMSPVRFMDQDPMSPDSLGSGSASTSRPSGTGLGQNVRWRPPRKSIDAGRLARQRSHQSHHSHASHRSVDSSVPNSPALGAAAAAAGGAGADRRKSSGLGQKPRYRWLSQPGGGTGDEPGVDVRSRRDEEAYGGLKGATTVTVVDYANYTPPQSQAGAGGGAGAGAGAGVGEGKDAGEEEEYGEDEGDMNFRVEFPGERLGEWLAGEGKRKVGKDGKSVGVRWIHVQGLNWEVIKTLTLNYNLHPLAVEDALRSSNSPRSKLDFYRSHLYLQLLIHHIHHSDEEAIEAALQGGVFHDDDDDEGGDESPFGADGDAEAGLGAAGSAVDGVAQGRGGVGGGPRRKGTIERLKEVLGRGKTRGGSRLGQGPQGFSGSGLRLPEGVEGVFEPSVGGSKLQNGESPYQKEAHRLTVDQLSAKYMVPIRRGIISIFMTREGTIITLSQRRFREVVNPIYERLEDDQSLLRRSADVSMLAQAFLDIAADLAVEVSQTFEAQILRLEASVLVDPEIATVRHLHILSSQLIRLRRAMTPLLHITSNIRDQDAQRSAAASAIPVKVERGGSIISLAGAGAGAGAGGHSGQSANTSVQSLTIPEYTPTISSMRDPSARGGTGVPGWATPREEPGSNRSYMPSASHTPPPPSASAGLSASSNGAPAVGYFSPLTKIYIGDVLDHLEMVVSSMDQYVAVCEHLTEYIFNILSFNTNESMERLSIVTVIFLPLTFISSFFGMNFTDFPQLDQSVNYFWMVSTPLTFGFFVIFSFSYIRSFFETGWRKTQRWRQRKEVEGRFRRGVGGGLGPKGE